MTIAKVPNVIFKKTLGTTDTPDVTDKGSEIIKCTDGICLETVRFVFTHLLLNHKDGISLTNWTQQQ